MVASLLSRTQSYFVVVKGNFYQLTISDINECTDGIHTCDSNATCSDSIGTFTCTCNSGYTGDGQSCMGKCLVQGSATFCN